MIQHMPAASVALRAGMDSALSDSSNLSAGVSWDAPADFLVHRQKAIALDILLKNHGKKALPQRQGITESVGRYLKGSLFGNGVQ